MSLVFPSVEFFLALQRELADDPSSTEDIDSEAYCGFAIDGSLFVVEFDGRECAAVVSGGNPLDLDFVLSGTSNAWSQAIAPEDPRPLAELVASNAIAVESEQDDGPELARAALPMLQAFFDQARGLEVEARRTETSS